MKPKMLEAIHLKNFRGFRDETLALKPLTVLLGPNGAGKSSFGRALAVLSHVHRTMSSAGLPRLAHKKRDQMDWPVDLGTYESLLTSGCKGPVQVGVTVGQEKVTWGFGSEKFPDLELTLLEAPFTGQPIHFVLDGKPVPPPSPDTATTTALGAGTPVPRIDGFHRENELMWRGTDGSLCRLNVSGLELTAALHDQVTSTLVNNWAFEKATALFDRTRYLRPTRAWPRHLYESESVPPTDVGYDGGNTADFVNRFRHHVVHFSPPKIPRDRTDAAALLDQPWTKSEFPLVEAISRWLQQLKLARGAKSEKLADGRLRLDARTHDSQPYRALIDLGFGLSQVIPVIVAGLTLPESGCLIVELPEAHLHPAPQGELGDFFCALVKAGHQVIVETHSEHLFDRLRLRAAQDSELADQIAVYFMDRADEDGNCKAPRRIGLDFDEELRWPEGFNNEGFNAEIAISAMQAARRAKDQIQ
jgi:hypothetical protein